MNVQGEMREVEKWHSVSFYRPQHARCRSRSIYADGEQAAYRRFCGLRWSENGGAPVCPACGCLDVDDLTSRHRFKCGACHRQFSVTPGTIFASRKLSFVDLLAAICLVVNASKGVLAVQLSRDLDVQHKTAFVLMHKLREAMAAETRDVVLARQNVTPGSVISADEVAHWDLLMADFAMRRINHSEAYSRDGAHTNCAESFFSRLRRMIGGQHHKVDAKHLGAYAIHAAWLEDHRHQSNGALADQLIARILIAPVSRTYKGYWQHAA